MAPSAKECMKPARRKPGGLFFGHANAPLALAWPVHLPPDGSASAEMSTE